MHNLFEQDQIASNLAIPSRGVSTSNQFSINESGELTNHIDLEVETARDGIAWSRVKKYLIILLLCITFLPL